MAKMFYTQEEAAGKLSVSIDEVKEMVREGRLREFMDNGPVYRVEDIDKMSGSPTPGDTDAIDLELVEEEAEPGKEDTVITSAGISVFDDDDLEIEADPMAQTQISPSMDDQISLETTGSGSGLLDLTREADDTSLGAELLEEIYPSAPSVEAADVMPSEPEPAAMPETPAFAPAAVMEAGDPSATAFGAMAVVGVIAAAILAVLVVAAANGVWPGFAQTLSDGNTPYIVGGALFVLMVLFGAVGMVIGRSSSGPRM